MKILIGDDHGVVRKGLIQIIQEEFPLAIITETADGKEMYEIAKHNKFDIIISDISMPNRIGLNFIKELKENQSSTPVLILTMHASEQYELRCIRAGACGFLNKESATEELIAAINSLLIGVKYVSKEVAVAISKTKTKNFKKQPHETLSSREFEVFNLMIEGKPSLIISEKLGIGPTTVSTFKKRIFNKIGVSTLADLIRYSVDNQLQ